MIKFREHCLTSHNNVILKAVFFVLIYSLSKTSDRHNIVEQFCLSTHPVSKNSINRSTESVEFLWLKVYIPLFRRCFPHYFLY